MYLQRLRGIAISFVALAFIASCGQQSESESKSKSNTESTQTEATESENTIESKNTIEQKAVVQKESGEKESSQTKQATKEPVKDNSTKSTLASKPVEPKKSAKSKTITLEIPAGMNVVITLAETIETGKTTTGDEFSGTLVDPIVIAGKTVFAAGTKVAGTVLNAVGSGRLKTDAELSLTLQSIADLEIQTDIIEDKASSHKERNKKLIGGGALVGGILGALKGKNLKGAIKGAVAGAAAGTGAAALTGKKNLRYEAGTMLQFTLAESAKVSVAK